jgi:hypothetical protein
MTEAAAPAGQDPFAIPPLWEWLYNFAALAAVTAFGYYFFWVFVIVLVPAMVGSVALMIVENIIIQSDKTAAAKQQPNS